jgi:hypothetical protein
MVDALDQQQEESEDGDGSGSEEGSEDDSAGEEGEEGEDSEEGSEEGAAGSDVDLDDMELDEDEDSKRGLCILYIYLFIYFCLFYLLIYVSTCFFFVFFLIWLDSQGAWEDSETDEGLEGEDDAGSDVDIDGMGLDDEEEGDCVLSWHMNYGLCRQPLAPGAKINPQP